jgi:GTP-binding protein HflX
MAAEPRTGAIAGHKALVVVVHEIGQLRDRPDPLDAVAVSSATHHIETVDKESETRDFVELCKAAGLLVGHVHEINLKRITAKYYIGSGQASEIMDLAYQQYAELIVISAPLNPVHHKNWTEEIRLPVLSRYDIIFSIFEQNAHTAEGKLQVELAKLRYELPRIVRSYEKLDPLAGGIGTLGPGEQLTERIKRRHRKRIGDIEKRLEKLRQQRALRRKQRVASGIFTASLIGFTNVGKSTLLNLLTGSGVLVADQYFATLDPTARKLMLPSGRETLLTDTVGFIRDLPPELLTAFMATLEELAESDILLHLADASHPRVLRQISSVDSILREIGIAEVPTQLVFNKCDAAQPAALEELKLLYPDALFISSLKWDQAAPLLGYLDGLAARKQG